MSIQHILLDPLLSAPPTTEPHLHTKTDLPKKETKVHPSVPGGENASLTFIGTATTILEWEGIRLMTDPNFLHAGDHVHLGPGVTSKRLTNPAVDLHDLPRIDCVLLSHYHEDHFDREVEAKLRRDLPIVSTTHAKEHLHDKKTDPDRFTAVHGLDTYQSLFLDIAPSPQPSQLPPPIKAIKVTAMPGKHTADGIASTVNHLLGAIPDVNGWMLELGQFPPTDSPEKRNEEAFECGYRIYISGDTVMVDELKSIPERYAGQKIDLMLVHLGGTMIPGPSMPLLMVTMDAIQGLQMIHLINPDITIPIHYNDYDVFGSPLSDFQKAITEAGMDGKTVYLGHGDAYKFKVR